MVNRVTFLAQISTLSYIVKNFKLGFLKKGSPKKFETQDLKWSLSTCKKLLKHFFLDIFLFQDISEDRCESQSTSDLLTVNLVANCDLVAIFWKTIFLCSKDSRFSCHFVKLLAFDLVASKLELASVYELLV